MNTVMVVHRGNFNKLDKFLSSVTGGQYILRVLDKYGQIGVDALAQATPKDTGRTAASWYYRKEIEGNTIKLVWYNSNVNKGVNIAMILQYGHGTGTGGYVQGVDYINPALKPVFDKLADDAWTEVRRA